MDQCKARGWNLMGNAVITESLNYYEIMNLELAPHCYTPIPFNKSREPNQWLLNLITTMINSC